MAFGVREFSTTVACSQCQGLLRARRGCQEVTLFCEACHAQFSLQEYANQLDDALEECLAGIACNRI